MDRKFCGCVAHHPKRRDARNAARALQAKNKNNRTRYTVACCPSGEGWVPIRVLRAAPARRPNRRRQATRLAQAW